jgi:DNA primase
MGMSISTLQKPYFTLARKYNIEIEETELTDAEKANTDLHEYVLGFEFAKDYFHQTLLKSEEGKEAIGLSYFKEEALQLKQ